MVLMPFRGRISMNTSKVFCPVPMLKLKQTYYFHWEFSRIIPVKIPAGIVHYEFYNNLHYNIEKILVFCACITLYRFPREINKWLIDISVQTKIFYEYAMKAYFGSNAANRKLERNYTLHIYIIEFIITYFYT